MKRFLLYLLMIATIVACSKGDDGDNPTPTPEKPKSEIKLETSSSNFTPEGGSYEISFTSTEKWTAEVLNSRADGWCSIYPTSGNAGYASITVTTQPNDTPDDRSASIVIKSGTASKIVKVSQKQKDALTVTSSTFEVDAKGGEVKIEVKANINFDYTIEESAKDWIKHEDTRALKTSTLTFSIAENDNTEKREAKIAIKSGGFYETVTIYQNGTEPSIIISKSEYVISSDGGTIGVEVTSNTDVSLEIPVDWVTENISRATSTNTYLFDIAPNEEYNQRTAEIKFTNNENHITEIVKIVQTQKDAIVVAKSEYEFGTNGGNLDFDIHTNVDVSVTISDNAKDWIQQVKTRALETKTLYFNVSACSTDERREGTITISGGSAKQTIKVKQSKPIYIPDAVFKAYCIENFDINKDGKISSYEASKIEFIDVYSDNIESLEGIEFFNNLVALTVIPKNDSSQAMGIGGGDDTGEWRDSGYYLDGVRVSGKIKSLDVSKNTILEYLDCSGNLIESLDLTNNSALKTVNAKYNLDLKDIKLPESITDVFLTSTSIETIDLSNLTELSNLQLDRGLGLKSLDISKNPKLSLLDVTRNNLYSIDISNNPNLTYFSCGISPISSLDVSKNTNLVGLDFPFSNVKEINLSNNTKLEGLTFQNANLSSIDISMLPELKNIHFGNYIKITDSDGSILNVVNTIKNIDLNHNTKLENLFATQLDLESIDISKNTALKRVFVEFNMLSTLDVSNSSNLNELYTYYNPNLSTIYISPLQQFSYSKDSHTKFAYKGGETNLYESSDYSKDGEVKQLQVATKGNGIDIVLMGDAYSDRLIADGTYDKVMNTAMEKFFMEEPYKSFRDHFNVYSVTAVSKNDEYSLVSSTAFSGFFGNETQVGGDDQRVFFYAQKAINDERINNALIVVIMNSPTYAGTCYMYNDLDGDWGNGASISYFPIGQDDEALAQVLHHEAGGHGFSKLADEYAYKEMGRIPEYEIEVRKSIEPYGWWKNVDFTNDPTKVKWGHLLNDVRYAYDGLGVFEGAFTYWTGVYRPTVNSIMNTNVGGFNAPSREAIYYRIHKLAYGADWSYDYEKFVEWDAKNRKVSVSATRNVSSSWDTPKDFKPLHAPVIMNTSWRNAKNNVPANKRTRSAGNNRNAGNNLQKINIPSTQTAPKSMITTTTIKLSNGNTHTITNGESGIKRSLKTTK